MAEKQISCFAPAKINLTLDVLGKREDGYHALKSVMQAVDLRDTLTFTALDSPEIHIACSAAELNGPDNLVYRAADLLKRYTGFAGGARAEIEKHIPAQGGLGGGSSDGAITILALNRFWNLGLSYETMAHLAAQIGSDTPFFIYGPTAYIEGRGEFVTPLPPLAETWLVLIKPPVQVSTARVFQTLTPDNYTDGSVSDTVAAALRASGIAPLDLPYINALERGVMQQYPQVADTRRIALELGARHVRMSGSGPTLYTLCATRAEAETLCAALVDRAIMAWAVKTLAAEEYPLGETGIR